MVGEGKIVGTIAKAATGAKGMGSAIGSVAGAKGAAIAGGAASAVSAATTQLTGALKSEAVVLIVLGFFQLFLRNAVGVSNFTFVLALIMFVVAGMAAASKFASEGATKLSVSVPMLIFFLWFFVFQTPIPGMNSQFLTLTLVSIVIILVAVLLERKNVAKGFVYGLIPIVFLFLDVGFVHFYVEILQLPLIPFAQLLIQWMPWWALCGWFLLPKNGNALTVIINVLFVIFILTAFVMPVIPSSYSESVLPSIAELQETEANMKSQLPKGENPAWSNFLCIFGGIQSPTIGSGYDINQCVLDRQRDSKIEEKCKDELKEIGTPLDTCIERELKAYDDAALADGTVDSTIKEFMKAEITFDKDLYGNQIYRNAGEDTLPFPATLKVENPNELEIAVTASCKFKPYGGEEFEGVIDGQSIFRIKQKRQELPIDCVPPEGIGLNGKYDVEFSTEFKGLKTESTLVRMFVLDYDSSDADLMKKESDTFQGVPNGGQQSSAPSEFARLNFKFGFPESSRVIEASHDSLRLVATIENVGNGRITNVERFDINLEDAGFFEESFDCLHGGNIALPETMRTGSKIKVATCRITMSSDIRNYLNNLNTPNPTDVQTFFATLEYDYSVENKKSFEVKVEGLTENETAAIVEGMA